MYRSKCGTANSDSAQFCSSCAQPLPSLTGFSDSDFSTLRFKHQIGNKGD
jgi:hypothetical protein